MDPSVMVTFANLNIIRGHRAWSEEEALLYYKVLRVMQVSCDCMEYNLKDALKKAKRAERTAKKLA